MGESGDRFLDKALDVTDDMKDFVVNGKMKGTVVRERQSKTDKGNMTVIKSMVKNSR